MVATVLAALLYLMTSTPAGQLGERFLSSASSGNLNKLARHASCASLGGGGW